MKVAKEKLRRPAGAPGDLDADRPRLHRRRGLAGDDAAGLCAGAAGHRQLRREPARARLCRDRPARPRGQGAGAAWRRQGSIRPTLSIQLSYNSSENHRNTMAAVADMLSNVGITASLNEMEGTGYFNYLREGGDFDIARAGWIGDYSDPQNFLYLNESGVSFNYSGLGERGIRRQDAGGLGDDRPRGARRAAGGGGADLPRRGAVDPAPVLLVPRAGLGQGRRAGRTTSSTTTRHAGSR